jgi:DNA-binding NarL/FixJ family response regulator
MQNKARNIDTTNIRTVVPTSARAGRKKLAGRSRAFPTKRKPKTKTKTQLMPAKNRRGILGLTARETEVLSWIAQGKTNHEIGVILSACTGTICKHVEHILCKLDVKNRTAAAVIALGVLAKGKNMSQLVR